MRTATFAVGLFAVGLMLGPASAEAQTRPERDAYATLARAVSAAQSDPARRRVADVRRAVERAFSVFQTHERRRFEAMSARYAPGNPTTREERVAIMRGTIRYIELLQQPSASCRQFRRTFTSAELLAACEGEYRQAVSAHYRYAYAMMDAAVEAATGLEGLVPRFIGFDIRYNAMLQRLGSAKLAVIQNQGDTLNLAQDPGSRRGTFYATDVYYYQPIRDLVNAAVEVAEGLASYREGGSVAAEAEAPAPAPAAPDRKSVV